MFKIRTSVSKPTRRTVLSGTAAIAALSGLSFGLPGSVAQAATKSVPDRLKDQNALCIAHHQELTTHLKSVLNSAYVDENTKNRMLTTAHCPHCKTALTPDWKDRASFSLLA